MDDVYNISMKTNRTGNNDTEFVTVCAKCGWIKFKSNASSGTETVAKSGDFRGERRCCRSGINTIWASSKSAELRGDELNSGIEQTPGLADAIAKGLGVATGELKKQPKR